MYLRNNPTLSPTVSNCHMRVCSTLSVHKYFQLQIAKCVQTSCTDITVSMYWCFQAWCRRIPLPFSCRTTSSGQLPQIPKQDTMRWITEFCLHFLSELCSSLLSCDSEMPRPAKGVRSSPKLWNRKKRGKKLSSSPVGHHTENSAEVLSVGPLSSNSDSVDLEHPQKCNLPDPTPAAVLSREEINLEAVEPRSNTYFSFPISCWQPCQRSSGKPPTMLR
jgi:hypothetical protein